MRMTKMTRTKRLILFAAVMAATAVLPVLADDAARFAGVMSQIVGYMNSGNYEAIHGLFNEVMAAQTNKEETAAKFRTIVEKLGKVTRVSPPQGVTVAQASFVLYLEKGIMDVLLALDSNDHVAGLAMKPRPPAAKVPDRQSVYLRLPFEGTWVTMAGGDTPAQNYHVGGHPSQRFAYDFSVQGADGLRYKNLGKKNEDFLAFGRKVLAPAAGTVVDVISGVRDNKPGQPNPFVQMGNAVVIQHKPGEFSVLAHLKYGSIVVRTGAVVKAGQLIGLAGNTGLTQEPQLHFSIQNQASLVEATGIRALFGRVKVTAGGTAKVRTDYMPVKGDLVSQG